MKATNIVTAKNNIPLQQHIKAYKLITTYVDDHINFSAFRESLKETLQPYAKQFGQTKQLYSGRTITQEKFRSFLTKETMQLKGRYVYSFSEDPNVAKNFFGSIKKDRASVFINKVVPAIDLKALFNHLGDIIEKETGANNPVLKRHNDLLSDYMDEEAEFLVIEPLDIKPEDVVAVTWSGGDKKTAKLLEERRKIFDTPAFTEVNEALKNISEWEKDKGFFDKLTMFKVSKTNSFESVLKVGGGALAPIIYEKDISLENLKANKPKTKKKTPVKDNLANKSVKPKDTKKVHWWDRLNKEQQIDYLKQFPKSKFKVNKT